MVIYLSLILCLVLFAAIAGVVCPELILPIFKRHWERELFYFDRHDMSR